MTSASGLELAQLLSGDLAIAALRRYPTRIKSAEEAMALKGVGEKTARKVGVGVPRVRARRRRLLTGYF